MCLSQKPTVDTSYQDFSIQQAETARAEETARQQRIDNGMQQIAAVFDGGTYQPQAQANNSLMSEMGSREGFLGDLFRGRFGDTAQADDGESSPQTYEGMQPVLDQRREAMEGFYLPQLNDQFSDSRDDLTFSLARAGQLNSSVAGDRQADLSRQFALQRSGIESDIASDIASTRSSMNQQRQALEAGLRSSGDATAATNAALASATTFRQDVPQLDSLGPVFAGLSQGIGAFQTGQQNGRIQRLATPDALQGSGQIVR